MMLITAITINVTIRLSVSSVGDGDVLSLDSVAKRKKKQAKMCLIYAIHCKSMGHCQYMALGILKIQWMLSFQLTCFHTH